MSNSVIFSYPVCNYSREFPFLWEEMDLPIAYGDDRERAERILLEVAGKHTAQLRSDGELAIHSMMHRYAMAPAELAPKVYFRITDNWLELGLRFVAPSHGARELKDVMTRDILREFDAAGIGIASATYDIVGCRRYELRQRSRRLRRASPTARLARRRTFQTKPHILPSSAILHYAASTISKGRMKWHRVSEARVRR